MNLPRAWEPHEESLLRDMWGKGASASQIAAELRGRSRNAVIGRIHRLNLQRSAKGPYMTKARRAKAAQEPKPTLAPAAPKPLVASPTLAFPTPVIVVPSPPMAPIKPKPVSTQIMTLWADWPSDRCRNPVYQGKIEADTKIFCGKAVEEPPYCAACAKVLRLPPKKKRTPAEEQADYQRALAMRRAKLKAAPR